MKWLKFPRKEFKERRPQYKAFHYTTEEGEHVVEVPYGASTRTKVHELGHVELGHESVEDLTIGEGAGREIDAEIYSFEHTDRPVDMEVVSNAIIRMVYREGVWDVNEVFEWSLEALEERGIELDKGERSALWHYIRKAVKQARKEGRRS